LNLWKNALSEKKRRIEQAQNLATWSLANLRLEGAPFSFKGHEYLRELYECRHDYVVFEKASQMGLSILALSKAIWACHSHGLRTIYFFPTDRDVVRFSQDRFGRIVRESPNLAKIINESHKTSVPGKADNVHLRRIGDGTLYFMGLLYAAKNKNGRSGGNTKTIDADFLIFDELDEAQPRQKEAAKHRVDHSRFRWIMELSTPTIPEYGIDVEFRKSDQRYWLLKCPHCGSWNCVEDEFPKCLLRIDEETVILACKKCHLQLDPAAGEWVPRYSHMRKRRGYHLCQLYSTCIDLNDVLNEFEDPNTDPALFYNHRLGIPYIESGDRLSREEIKSCFKDDTAGENHSPAFMGVDVHRKEFYVIITTPVQDGKMKVIYSGRVPVANNPVEEEFAGLSFLINKYNVERCVIDAQPETHTARRFAKAHPGLVYLCYYVSFRNKDVIWKEDDDGASCRVNIDRVESLDATIRMIKRHGLEIPFNGAPLDELADHLHALVRTRRADPGTGEQFFRYVSAGDDHFAHALNYCRIAQEKGRENQRQTRIIITGKINSQNDQFLEKGYIGYD